MPRKKYREKKTMRGSLAQNTSAIANLPVVRKLETLGTKSCFQIALICAKTVMSLTTLFASQISWYVLTFWKNFNYPSICRERKQSFMRNSLCRNFTCITVEGNWGLLEFSFFFSYFFFSRIWPVRGSLAFNVQLRALRKYGEISPTHG